jgi:hypothetical protein
LYIIASIIFNVKGWRLLIRRQTVKVEEGESGEKGEEWDVGDLEAGVLFQPQI